MRARAILVRGVASDERARRNEKSRKLIEALRQHFPIESLGGHGEWAKLRDGRRSCPGAYGMIATDMLRTLLGLKKPA